MLQGVLDAQRIAASIVGDYETLRHSASIVVEHARALGSPVVWPVGEAADRLAGAAVLIAGGDLRLRGWTDDLRGERVVVLAVADLSTLALQQAARHARVLGAAEVHACWLGFEEVVTNDRSHFDGFCALETLAPAVVDARSVVRS